MLLLPVALFVNLKPVVRSVRAGHSLGAARMNLSLAVVIALVIVMTWGGMLADQLPCFLGVPNCD